jgi:sarcosine oxidase subunit alpha
LSFRLRPPADPVTITLDGDAIVAQRGEPLAAALVAADDLVLARSPKFHRPRGPSCMRAACDGCLARVDEAPNVMTCMVAAADGTAVVSQNRLGSRDADLLRMTDWFFPDGMNHHELFAGVPGVQSIMQSFARRVAGLGRLPAEGARPRKSGRRAADVVVVGAGPSGLAVASHAAAAGHAVEVIDDQLEPGGGLVALAPDDVASFAAIRAEIAQAIHDGRVRLRSSTVAGGIYGRDLLVVGPEGAEVLEPRALVLASGAHDGVLAFEGNDVPGVMSARAAGLLLARGVAVGARVVVVVPEGGGPFGASYARAVDADADAKAKVSVDIVYGEPIAVKGSTRVKGVRVRTASGEEKDLVADAVLVDAPRSPAYELAEQAGASLVHEPRGFVVRTDGGRIRDGVFAAGEVAGIPFDVRAFEEDAARIAAAL